MIDPKAKEGLVGCAVTSNIHRFYTTPDGEWRAEKIIQVPPKHVEGWVDSKMAGTKLLHVFTRIFT